MSVRVSIHALLAECDGQMSSSLDFPKSFNPRTPCGVRQTLTWAVYENGSGFNPRTPCGVRPYRGMSWIALQGFNPRTPCGVRHTRLPHCQACLQFQSTHSLRSATVNKMRNERLKKCFNPRTPCGVRLLNGACDWCEYSVSIHALLAECDKRRKRMRKRDECFNPRTPCGVRQMSMPTNLRKTSFQSTHSLRSATSRFSAQS